MFYFEVLEQNLLVLIIIEAALTFSICEGIFLVYWNIKQRSLYFYYRNYISLLLKILNIQKNKILKVKITLPPLISNASKCLVAFWCCIHKVPYWIMHWFESSCLPNCRGSELRPRNWKWNQKLCPERQQSSIRVQVSVYTLDQCENNL